MIPISKDMIEPTIKTNGIKYVNGIEEFENIHLDPNQVILCFDNSKPCFYVRECDRNGNDGSIQIYFYETFAERVQRYEVDDFIIKCKKAGLDELKIELAYKFFVENKKPYDVWLWAINEKGKDWEWDYVRNLRHRLKLKLFKVT